MSHVVAQGEPQLAFACIDGTIAVGGARVMDGCEHGGTLNAETDDDTAVAKARAHPGKPSGRLSLVTQNQCQFR